MFICHKSVLVRQISYWLQPYSTCRDKVKMPDIMSTEWQFFKTSAAAWEIMEKDCEAAQTSIDCEQYIFLNDEGGSRLYEILMRKAKEGVRVRLILDSAGSFSVTHSPAFLERLRAAGVELKVFNPIEVRKVHNAFIWVFRDHRKILVVDNKIGQIGGICLQGNMRDWRDTHIRITGDIVAEFIRTFDRMWRKGLHRYPRFRREAPMADGFELIVNAPRLRQRYVYHTLLSRIRRARREVLITTPYFIPNYRFFRTLRRAVKRGVDVRLILANVSDHTFVDRASDFHVGPALRAGIRVYRYLPPVLHAKSIVIDDWATVGSTNIDNLSLLLNNEANLGGTAPRFVEELRAMFFTDIESSHELSAEEWRSRPLKAKILEKISWPLHRVF